MPLSIGHTVAVTLLAASLTTAAVKKIAYEPNPPNVEKVMAADETPACTTPREVMQKATDVVLNLTGEDLAKFHANYTAKMGRDPPDIDRLIVTASVDPTKVILILFKDNCATGYQVVPLDEFMAIYKGQPA